MMQPSKEADLFLWCMGFGVDGVEAPGPDMEGDNGTLLLRAFAKLSERRSGLTAGG